MKWVVERDHSKVHSTCISLGIKVKLVSSSSKPILKNWTNGNYNYSKVMWKFTERIPVQNIKDIYFPFWKLLKCLYLNQLIFLLFLLIFYLKYLFHDNASKKYSFLKMFRPIAQRPDIYIVLYGTKNNIKIGERKIYIFENRIAIFCKNNLFSHNSFQNNYFVVSNQSSGIYI